VNGRPWWTEADRAELAVLVAELVALVPEHRSVCVACKREREDGWPCPALTLALESVFAWRWRRDLLSRAEWLRGRREAA
jgi:hypothetical protein